MSNTKIIYSLRIHLELQKKGFVPLIEMRNPHAPNFNCWVYEANQDLLGAFDQLVREVEDKDG